MPQLPPRSKAPHGTGPDGDIACGVHDLGAADVCDVAAASSALLCSAFLSVRLRLLGQKVVLMGVS